MAVMKGDNSPSVALVQDGARLHYAVAIALARAGLLRAMFTDWFVPSDAGLAAAGRRGVCAALRMVRPALAARLAARSCPELRGARVEQSLVLTLRQALARRRFASSTDYFHHCSRLVTQQVRSRRFAGADTLMGFIRNLDPELVIAARQAGLTTIGDQIIAPATIEMALLREQRQRWSGWEPAGDVEDLAPVAAWERRTWDALHHITCASEFVREGLIAQGVASDRISVLPYPLAGEEWTHFPRGQSPGDADRGGANRGTFAPLTVGFVGAVNLRKGAPAFFEVARRLAGERVRFVMVGPVRLSSHVIADQRGRIEFVGAVPRTQVARHLAAFDLMLFPSVCEGSASAVMEAMAAGVPVVTTANAGSVIRHGVDGFIAPPHDLDALAAHVDALSRDDLLRRAMSMSARARAAEFSLDRYSRDLAALVRRVTPRSD